jgi:hypothetical protein
VLQAAAGRRKAVEVYGGDFPTRDGTCVRDYVHVSDLCDAHLRALEWLETGGGREAVNLGTGRGASVLEVIDAACRVTGVDVPKVMVPRRPGGAGGERGARRAPPRSRRCGRLSRCRRRRLRPRRRAPPSARALSTQTPTVRSSFRDGITAETRISPVAGVGIARNSIVQLPRGRRRRC